MNKFKKNKGITLVALIITIIVLLILAVVSIRAVTGDGIMQYAKNARSEYGKAQTNEATILDSYLKELDEATKGDGLTTGFFSTPINSTVTQYNFYSCGFKDASGNAATSIDGVKTLFTNKYTQMEGTTPKVQSITQADIDAVWGSDTTGGTYVTSNDLLAIPCKSPEDSEYAMTWLASANDGANVWGVDDFGDVNNGYDYVIRGASCSFSEI